VREGALAGLLDPRFMQSKQAAEAQLRARVASTATLASAQGAWDRIAQAEQAIATHAAEYDFLERGNGFSGDLFGIARHLVRAAAERPKPNGDRLEEYRDSARASFEHDLFAERPIYADLETLKLGDSLTYLVEVLGYNHAVAQTVLAGKSPRNRAIELVRGTRLGSVAVRRELYDGGQAAVEACHDPMVDLARAVDAEARAARKAMEAQREAIRQAHAQIGKARYVLEGDRNYPDATSSLRLAFGVVKGYEEAGRSLPFATTFAGLFQRASQQKNRPPFDLPVRWEKKRKRLNSATPFNFVCTADIIGGNSGSPAVNRKGEFVGIIFDGNIQSLIADFVYTEEQGRALCVHSQAIIEALERVYNARPLANELLGRKP
jgi:hypothetical protein